MAVIIHCFLSLHTVYTVYTIIGTKTNKSEIGCDFNEIEGSGRKESLRQQLSRISFIIILVYTDFHCNDLLTLYYCSIA